MMLKRTALVSLLLLAVCFSVFGADGGEIERRIAALEGVTETKALPSGEFAGKYEVMIEQPLNWRRPAKGTFLQRVVAQCLPYVGYPRSLNAMACIGKASES